MELGFRTVGKFGSSTGADGDRLGFEGLEETDDGKDASQISGLYNWIR